MIIQWAKYADSSVIETGRPNHIAYEKQTNYDDTKLYRARFPISFTTDDGFFVCSNSASGSEYRNFRYFDYIYGYGKEAVIFQGDILMARMIMVLGY